MLDCILQLCYLTLLHSKWPKLYGVLAILSTIGLKREEAKETVGMIVFLPQSEFSVVQMGPQLKSLIQKTGEAATLVELSTLVYKLN